MKRIYFLLSFLLVSLKLLAQQSITNDKYIFNGLYINPAYAGYKEDMYIESFYKSQWTGFTGAPTSYSLAADALVPNSKVGLGLVIQGDNIGAQSDLSLYGNYAYRIRLSDDQNAQLSFGVGLGFVQNGIDGTKLNAVDNGDNVVPANFQSLMLPDSRAGVMYTSDILFAGVSMDNMIAQYFKKASSIYGIAPKPMYYVTAGTMLTFNDDVRFKPSFLIRDQQDGVKNIDLNAYFLLGDRFWLGLTYRTDIKSTADLSGQSSNAMAAHVEIVVNDKLRLGYAFDYSMGSFGNTNYGSHEISIGWYLKSEKKKYALNDRYF